MKIVLSRSLISSYIRLIDPMLQFDQRGKNIVKA
jgi:hypothetical protein